MNVSISISRSPDDRYAHPVGGTNLLTIGARSYAGNSRVFTYENTPVLNILIGRYCSLADDILFLGGYNHVYRNAVTTYPFDVLSNEFNSNGATYPTANIPSRASVNRYQIIIGHDVWIGRYATIMGGVKIGSGAIIGTNAMVAKDVPPYAIAVGNPARVVKYRFDAETIRKFMAVKWWNWDVDKIVANVPKMYDVEKFLAEHYTSALARIPYAEIGEGYRIEQHIAEGRKIYAFVADFKAAQPLWKRVVSGFLKSTDSNAVMLFWAGEGATQADLDNLRNFANSIGLSAGKIIHVMPQKFSPYLLRNSTHFITTREMVTLECLDWLYDTNVKVVSALDDGIFAGEPPVSWKDLYAIS